jgi:hypothetical protein
MLLAWRGKIMISPNGGILVSQLNGLLAVYPSATGGNDCPGGKNEGRAALTAGNIARS